jgi:transcriptional regulator with XRE-family HTH domain
MELGDMIRSERTRKGWSQREFAKMLGVSPGAVAQWELGDTRPTLERMIDVCGVFGIAASSFLGPGSPYRGQIIEDADEISLLAAWRKLSGDRRLFLLEMLRTQRPAPPT